MVSKGLEHLRQRVFQIMFPNIKRNFILNRIGHHLTHDTTAEEPISPQERLGICLCRLGRCDYYHTSEEMAGCALTAVLIDYIDYITQEVCKVIVEFGGMDDCHVSIKCPRAEMKQERSIIFLKNFILSL